MVLVSCERPAPSVRAATTPAATAEAPDAKREVRVTGVIQAVHASKVLVPAITGQYNRMTLTRIIAGGSHVSAGDPIASFDATVQMDAARDAQAKGDDLGHQADQKRAQNRADAEKRTTDLQQAEADLAKAQIELRKGPVLADIGRLKNEEKARIATLHVESLKKSNALHDQADAAALRILELQRDRQRVALERAQTNVGKLDVKAPLAGMVALENLNRGNSLGHAQEGDQLYRGQPLVSIFDPSEMRVRCSVGEPDIEAIVPGSKANVYLDAYPDLVLPAHFEFASPVASAGLNSPIKTFTAVFRIDKTDPHLLPDLSAAVVLDRKAATGTSGARLDKSGADALVRARPPGRALALIVNPSARQDSR
jgi:multidrug efflux pump subunit AcrA (membrane-fusion protein)